MRSHTRAYRLGNYNVLDVDSALRGERKEIWHGWKYARSHMDEYLENRRYITDAVEKQLKVFRIFIAEIEDVRKRERLEAALMFNLYVSKKPFAELADRGMFLKGRYNSEIPINIKNYLSSKIYGIPKTIEV